MKPIKHFFTLIEILTVAAIIAVLAGISVGVISLISNKNAEAKTLATIKALELALGQYKAEFGHPFFQYNQHSHPMILEIPSPFSKDTDHNLAAYISGKMSPYPSDPVKKEITFKTSLIKFLDMKMITQSVKDKEDNPNIAYFADGWGRPLIYRIPGRNNKTGYDLGSVGPDGKVGDGQKDDDIISESKLPEDGNVKRDYAKFGQGDDITNFLKKN